MHFTSLQSARGSYTPRASFYCARSLGHHHEEEGAYQRGAATGVFIEKNQHARTQQQHSGPNRKATRIPQYHHTISLPISCHSIKRSSYIFSLSRVLHNTTQWPRGTPNILSPARKYGPREDLWFFIVAYAKIALAISLMRAWKSRISLARGDSGRAGGAEIVAAKNAPHRAATTTPRPRPRRMDDGLNDIIEKRVVPHVIYIYRGGVRRMRCHTENCACALCIYIFGDYEIFAQTIFCFRNAAAVCTDTRWNGGLEDELGHF